jgi:hypothetical protein
MKVPNYDGLSIAEHNKLARKYAEAQRRERLASLFMAGNLAGNRIDAMKYSDLATHACAAADALIAELDK